MKKSDIIKLVKETVAERRKRYGQHDYYGNNVGGRNSISGMPGVWEEGLELEIDDEFVELVDDSGEYSGEIESDGSVSFSVVDDEVEGEYEHGFADWNWKDVLGPKHAFVKISEKIPTEVEALGDYVMITVNIDDLKSISGKQMDEEGESWGLEPRQLADSFTFEELEQLYNDNKITKEDLNGAKSYLQAWIDQHPTYLPQRDLNTSKRQAIRSYYLDPDRTTPKGGTQSSQFEDKQNKNKMKKQKKEATYAGKTAVDDMTDDPAYNALDGDAKMQLKKDLSKGGTATLEEDDESLLAEYMKERGDSNLMEHMDRHRKRTQLMEGAVKRLFIDFDLGKTNEEIIQDYASKGIQIPDSWISQMRKEWEGFEKMKLNLDIGEKEFKNAATQIVNNPEGSETGMEPPMESKQLANGLTN